MGVDVLELPGAGRTPKQPLMVGISASTARKLNLYLVARAGRRHVIDMAAILQAYAHTFSLLCDRESYSSSMTSLA